MCTPMAGGVRIGAHFNTNTYEIMRVRSKSETKKNFAPKSSVVFSGMSHICMSRQQYDLVYALAAGST